MLDVYEIATARMKEKHVLFVNVLFGLAHRRIADPRIRQWTTSIFGFVQILLIFQWHVWHFLACVLLNAFLVAFFNHRKCHIIVTCITLTYVSLFRLIYYEECKLSYNRILMVHLSYSANVIGLAFDKYISHRDSCRDEKNQNFYSTDPGFLDIIHFSFCHTNLTSVGFFRYRTYEDFIDGKFAMNSHVFKYIGLRLIKMEVYGRIYKFGFGLFWPIGYITTDEFQNSNIFYKMCYSSLHMMSYYLWMYVAFLSSEVVAASAGFGAYPVQGENQCGHGPTNNYKALKQMSAVDCRSQTYDYITIMCTDAEKNFFTPWMSEFIRTWNSTYQYWISTIIYKNVSTNIKGKEQAMFLTFMFSAVWHGISPGFYVSCIFLPFFTMTMKYYWKISQHFYGWKNQIFLFAVWCMRMFFFGYIGIPFLLFHFNYILHYFNSVYYLPLILHCVVHVGGIIGLKHLKNSKRIME